MSMLTWRWRIATAALLATVGLTIVGVASVTAKGSVKADHGTSYVAVTHQVGSTYIAAGDATDNNLGKGAVSYTITAGTGTKPGTIKITARRVTVFSSTGSLYGTAAGTETTLASGAVTLTGKLNLTHGTGGQKGHRLIATFTGTGKTPLGPFVFHTKGTYK
ncbi:MAG: hypothetical protein M3Z06_15145 [Actinomycetota bacterium]|nr:hypothetical protein [Actinomycetota bacterium]